MITALSLHFCDLGICYSKTAASVTHHGVELVETESMIFLIVLNRLALVASARASDIIFLSRNEFVKRRIEESDSNRVTLKSLIESFSKSPCCIGSNLGESSFSLLNSVGADHLTESSRFLIGLKEHMLSTAKTDTLSAELSCLLSVSRSISVCSYLKSSVLISPSHNSAEVTSDLMRQQWG